MINRTLHLVSNRRDFVSPYLFPDPDFVPAPASPSDAVRRILGLEVTSSDYHVKAVVFAVHAHAWLDLKDPIVTYKVTDFDRDPVETIGAVWVFDENGAPAFSPEPVSAPVPDVMRLEAITETRAHLTYGEFVSEISTRWVTGQQHLYPNWPAALGVSGGLLLDFDWQPGSSLLIRGYPNRYPWAAVAAALAQSEYCHALLLTTGLLEHFQLADNDMEKVAVTGLALARAHPAYNV